MSDFKSFKSIGDAFQGGMQSLGRKDATYAPRYRTLAAMDVALRKAGQHYVEHFKDKFDEGGPGWPYLQESTLDLRARRGNQSTDVLDETGALKKAIRAEWDATTMSLEVGVGQDIHVREGNGVGADSAVMMETLMERMEQGYTNPGNSMFPGAFVPPRRVFTDSDFPIITELIVDEFARHALFGLVDRVRE